ncbi:MAG: PhnD/SsuA/transferrin family substrate-binding protein [Gammaproteobacteria bacterium]|nr:PhnD/SsuA/transferrin family substrate-binding protein [Gammaproteobacteria bacterium]
MFSSLRRLVVLILTFMTLFGMINLSRADTLRLGVLAPRGELKAQARWTELADYFKTETGHDVKLVPLAPSRVVNAAQQKQVDFVLSHSPHTVQLEEKLGATVLATLNTKDGSRFGGVIVARKDSGIKTGGDLRGKNVMSLKFRAAAGAYIFQTYHLMKEGIDPQKDFGSLREGKKQDDLVLAVQNGLIDAAFVRTGLLETMQREGKITLSDFQIVDQQTGDGFSLLRSTELYPEWCLSVLPGVSNDVAAQFKAAALKLKPDQPAAQKARINGFVEPVPLDKIKQALRFLHISPYNT